MPGARTSDDQQAHIKHFLNEMDTDMNGEVGTAEATQYIETYLGSSGFEDVGGIKFAVEEAFQEIDSFDTGFAIDSMEMHDHLKGLLSAERVAAWMSYGVQLPSYADAFLKNAITGADFPMLINEGDYFFETELGIKNRLHRDKVLRALRLQVLGLTSMPGSPSNLVQMLAPNGEGVTVEWEAPSDTGRPSVHGYLVQRRNRNTLRWEVAGFVTDDLSYTDETGGSEYEYRVQSWNLGGQSEWAGTDEGTVFKVKQSSLKLEDLIESSSGERAESAGQDSTLKFATTWIAAALFFVSFIVRFIHFNKILAYIFRILMFPLRRFTNKWKHQSSDSDSDSGERKEDDASSPSRSRVSSADIIESRILGNGRRHSIADFQHPLKNEFIERDAVHRRNSYASVESVDAFENPQVDETTEGAVPANRKSSASTSSAEAEAFTETHLWQDLEPPPCPPADSPTRPKRISSLKLERMNSNAACAFPGCTKRWDRFRLKDFKNSYRRHYCCSCQQFYCHKHTRISSHSVRVTCDIGSTCYCESCYDNLDPQHAVKLKVLNQFDTTLTRS